MVQCLKQMHMQIILLICYEVGRIFERKHFNILCHG